MHAQCTCYPACNQTLYSGFAAPGCKCDCTLSFWTHLWSSRLGNVANQLYANKSYLNIAWRPCEMTFFRTKTMYWGILQHTQSFCIHPLGVYTNPPPPVPLTLNQSPKDIAGSGITNCLTYTCYIAAWRVKQTLEVSSRAETYHVFLKTSCYTFGG